MRMLRRAAQQVVVQMPRAKACDRYACHILHDCEPWQCFGVYHLSKLTRLLQVGA